MGRNRWGQKAWIVDYWLKRMKDPFEEPYSTRQLFYKELPEIVGVVPDKVKETSKAWASNFYIYMSRYLSDLMLERKVSYSTINVHDDSGASTYIWQKFRFVEKRPPIGEGFVEYPIEVWVENNATYNSLIPLFKWDSDKQMAPFQLNLLSQRGWTHTQRIEEALLDRNQDIKVILNLTDFDPSGYFMHEDLQCRCREIGLNVDVIHIGILPSQIPEERRLASLITYNRNDPRRRRFQEEFKEDPMVMSFHGYEIQALTPPEIRQFVAKSIETTIKRYGFERRTENGSS